MCVESGKKASKSVLKKAFLSSLFCVSCLKIHFWSNLNHFWTIFGPFCFIFSTFLFFSHLYLHYSFSRRTWNRHAYRPQEPRGRRRHQGLPQLCPRPFTERVTRICGHVEHGHAEHGCTYILVLATWWLKFIYRILVRRSWRRGKRRHRRFQSCNDRAVAGL